jgi:hypothetical protein
MDRILVNLPGQIGRAKRVTLGGREYITAPMSLIVPGVLPGSKGPLYYPPEECAANSSDWDNMKLVVRHPFDPLTGEYVSASTPGVEDIGFARSSVFKGKLRSQGFFDVEKVRNADKELAPEHKMLPRLLSGKPIELSTGLYTDNEEAPVGANHNGRPYTHIARNYRPDHIAILPDAAGACSIKDGCGVMVNSAPETNQRRGIVENHGWLYRLGQALGLVSNDMMDDSPGGFDDEGEAQESATGQSKPAKVKKPPKPHAAAAAGSAEAATRIQQMHGNAQARHDQNNRFLPVGGKLDVKGLSKAAQKGHSELYSKIDPTAVSKLVGPKNGPNDIGRDADKLTKKPGEPLQGDTTIDYEKVIGTDKSYIPTPTHNHEDAMIDVANLFGGGTPHDASKQAAAATVQADHPPAHEPALAAVGHSKDGNAQDAADSHEDAAESHEDQATAMRGKGDENGAQDHDQAAALHRKAASMHAATCNSNGGPTVNRASLIAHLTNNCSCFKGKDAAALNSLSDSALATLASQSAVANAAKKGFRIGTKHYGFNATGAIVLLNEKAEGSNADAIGSGSIEAGGEKSRGYEGEQEESAANPRSPADEHEKGEKVGAGVTKNRLTPEEQEDLMFARNEKNKLKMSLITRLTSNVQEPVAKARHIAALGKKTLNELRNLVELMGPQQDRSPSSVFNAEAPGGFLGAQEDVNANAASSDDDVLTILTMNELNEQDKRGAKAATA